MRIRLLSALLLVLPFAARAQRVSGTVRFDSVTILSGVVVTTLDSAGRTIARTLSDARGRYSLPLATGVAQVRAVKIGFRPVSVAIPRTAGDVTMNLAMQRAAVILQTVKVSAGASCAGSSDGRMVLDVWDQARSALLAAIVAREARPAQVTVLEYQRRMEAIRRVVTEQRFVRRTGTATRPIAAARSGAQLARTGYRAQDLGDDIYFAPDADVLFDDSFSETHCFGLTRGAREHAGQIGLDFRPREIKRDFVDVEGVLWLSSQATELIQLDYLYTNVDPEATRAGSGGTVHFRTMSNGVVMIDSWSILLPEMMEVRRPGSAIGERRSTVTGLTENGGYVLDATWTDSTRWSNPLGGVRGVVTAGSPPAPVGDVVVSAPGASSATSMTGTFLLSLPPGRYRLGLVDSAFAGYVEPREQTREILVGRSDTVTANFQVPSREKLIADLCAGNRGPGTSVLLGEVTVRGGSIPDKVVVRSSWVSSRGNSAALDLDELRHSRIASPVGADGKFYICGLPAQSSWITLQIEAGHTPIIDTLIAPSSIDAPSAAGIRRFEWTLPAGIFEAAMRNDAAVLSGRVIRDGKPVPGAEVWLVFVDTTVTTDSLGRYRVGGLGAGQQLVQARRIGYAVKRDSVTLKARQETKLDFVMDAIELDTVRTTGKGRSYEVPRLQDFERRRLSGMGGHFISEDELRKHESRSVADILRSYAPGVRFEPIRGTLLAYSASAPLMTGNTISRGPVRCYVSVYLDGVLLYGGEPRAQPPDMNQFLAMNLSGVEYYGSAANLPLQYKDTKNSCGTLLLWTRGK